MSSEVLYAFFATCLLLILTPGPDLIFVVSQSITRGRKLGFAVALGQVGGLIFHLSLFAFGVSTLIVNSEWIYKSVKVLGGLYLLWLAYSAYKSEATISFEETELSSNSFVGFMWKGLLMNVLNPKVMLFFLALFPSFISEQAGDIKEQVLILGLVFITQTLVIFSVICIIASQLTDVLRDNKTFNTIVKWMQVILFTGLGLYVLL